MKRNIQLPDIAHGWRQVIVQGTLYSLHPTKGWRKDSKKGEFGKVVFQGITPLHMEKRK